MTPIPVLKVSQNQNVLAEIQELKTQGSTQYEIKYRLKPNGKKVRQAGSKLMASDIKQSGTYEVTARAKDGDKQWSADTKIQIVKV